MSDADPGYNDSHRAFLQAFMARGSMTFEAAKPVLAAICSVHGNKRFALLLAFPCLCRYLYLHRLVVFAEEREIHSNDITQANLTNYISAVNMAISSFDLEIRSSMHQTSQTRVYALVNTTSDPMTQLATTYNADEIAYVKRLLDMMFERNNSRRQEAMVVSEMQAAQLAKVTSSQSSGATQAQTQAPSAGGSVQSLTLKDAENVLARLVDEGWFEKSHKGNYMLSPRALMELKGWLIATYNDEEDEDRSAHPRARGGKIKLCFACGDIITMVQPCSDYGIAFWLASY